MNQVETNGKKKLSIEEMLPSKTLAKEAGHRFYFTGVPCRKGHTCPRYTSNGMCVQCIKDRYVPRPKKKTKKVKRIDPRRRFVNYEQYLQEKNRRGVPEMEEISFKVEKGSYLAKYLHTAQKAIENLNFNQRYGRDRLTIPEMMRSRQEAIKKGHSHYFNWQMCRNGHIVPRTIRNDCNQCVRDATARNTLKKQKEKS